MEISAMKHQQKGTSYLYLLSVLSAVIFSCALKYAADTEVWIIWNFLKFKSNWFLTNLKVLNSHLFFFNIEVRTIFIDIV